MPAPLPLPAAPPSTPLSSPTARPITAASSPTPQRPAATGSSVTVFDEQEYQWKSNDDFAKLSQQYYGSTAYANALQRHNQNHARASQQMNEKGTPAPGERIYIPQSRILEQRYADAISKPASPTVPAAFVDPSSAPPRLTPAPMPQSAPTPAPH
jgi:hypothetical protein